MADESTAHAQSAETPAASEGEYPIDLTEAAAAEVRRLMTQENLPGHLLRVAGEDFDPQHAGVLLARELVQLGHSFGGHGTSCRNAIPK